MSSTIPYCHICNSKIKSEAVMVQPCGHLFHKCCIGTTHMSTCICGKRIARELDIFLTQSEDMSQSQEPDFMDEGTVDLDDPEASIQKPVDQDTILKAHQLEFMHAERLSVDLLNDNQKKKIEVLREQIEKKRESSSDASRSMSHTKQLVNSLEAEVKVLKKKFDNQEKRARFDDYICDNNLASLGGMFGTQLNVCFLSFYRSLLQHEIKLLQLSNNKAQIDAKIEGNKTGKLQRELKELTKRLKRNKNRLPAVIQDIKQAEKQLNQFEKKLESLKIAHPEFASLPPILKPITGMDNPPKSRLRNTRSNTNMSSSNGNGNDNGDDNNNNGNFKFSLDEMDSDDENNEINDGLDLLLDNEDEDDNEGDDTEDPDDNIEEKEEALEEAIIPLEEKPLSIESPEEESVLKPERTNTNGISALLKKIDDSLENEQLLSVGSSQHEFLLQSDDDDSGSDVEFLETKSDVPKVFEDEEDDNVLDSLFPVQRTIPNRRRFRQINSASQVGMVSRASSRKRKGIRMQSNYRNEYSINDDDDNDNYEEMFLYDEGEEDDDFNVPITAPPRINLPPQRKRKKPNSIVQLLDDDVIDLT
eukprot:TRINITY_DN3022_c0_g1_i2.p1 TRINITY_DN3022_c0_g1~~TRINITY_DN3022_c0_g1_i2.p1  ORF type:complete len:588 (-),score=190.79 TRINITY_DN3022_c0_g1_i2:78-1841(-)